MSDGEDRFIQIIHSVPGRLRLRLPWLRRESEETTRLADRLVAVPGMLEVEVRARTGSVLCRYDPARLDVDRIVQAMKEATGAATVLEAGQQPPRAHPHTVGSTRAAVARELTSLFRDLNDACLRVSDGTVDLPTVAAFGFAAAGAAQIVVRQQIPPPPWFNLGWWGFRLIAMFEGDDAMEHEGARLDGDHHGEEESHGEQ
jgi:hypothetical protein